MAKSILSILPVISTFLPSSVVISIGLYSFPFLNSISFPRQKSEINYPIIVPIVIYTGKEKWKSNKSAKEKGIGEKVLENYNVNIEYNLIETNKLTEVFLLKQKSIFRL